MSFLAAVLLLNMEGPDAFICLANLLNRSCYNVFFRVDYQLVSYDYPTWYVVKTFYIFLDATVFCNV